MEFIQHLRIRTPLIWVQTTEPDRAVDIVCHFSSNDLFMMDPLEGLCKYVDEQWRPVLVESLNEMTGLIENKQVHSLPGALKIVFDEKGCFIIRDSHLLNDDLLSLYNHIFSKYRKGFFTNSLEEMGPQIVAISFGAEMPKELATHFAFVDLGLPQEDELAFIASHIHSKMSNEADIDQIDLSALTKAGIGLNEQEFFTTCLLSLKETDSLDPAYVLKWKLDRIKQGGLLEIRRPSLDLDDIGGLDLAKEMITNVVWAWNNPQEAKDYGIIPLRRFLFVGVPGTGKSAICEAAASSLHLDLAKFGISQMMNKYIGESERRMREAFTQVAAMAPLVCWMDELGRDLSNGDFVGDSGTTNRVHGEFLTGIQELPDNVLLMAAANRIDAISPETLRADRFDKILFVGLPTFGERIGIFDIHLGAESSDYNLEALAYAADTFTGAEIKALIREAKFKISGAQHRHITTEDLIELIPMMRNRIWIKHRDLVIDMYKRAVTDWDWASSQQLEEASLVITGNSTAPVRKNIIKTSF